MSVANKAVHEALEETSQDAARFRWCMVNPGLAAEVFRSRADEGHRHLVDLLRGPHTGAPGEFANE